VLLALAARAEDIKVGVTTAVNPEAVGRPPAAAAHTLFIGGEVLFKERIATTESGQAQLVFLDQSSLTVAPNSEVTIDEFVYDPKQTAGKLAANVTKGLVRYVGGAISKQSEVQFTTPSAVIGIRGGVVLILVNQKAGTIAAFLYGRHMHVTANGVTEAVTRPGFTVTVDQPGQPPSSPAHVQREFIQEALQALEGRPGSAGGATELPTDARVAQTGLAKSLEAISPSVPPNAIVIDVSQIEDTADKTRAAQNQARDRIVQTTRFSSGGPPPPPPPPPQTKPPSPPQTKPPPGEPDPSRRR
jgi:hypothetical protein